MARGWHGRPQRALAKRVAAADCGTGRELADIPRTVYARLVSSRFDIELEPEVRDWLGTLRLKDYAKVEAMADILAERAETLGEPYSRHLSGKTRELRFHLDRAAVRISYWLAPGA